MALDTHSSPLMPAKMSYEEFLRWNCENQRAEWVNGEVVVMPPISGEHDDVHTFVQAILRHFVEEHRCGALRHDPFQMKTGPDLPGRAPDILFRSKESLPRLNPTYLDGPADLVIEIISAESRARDRGEKYYEYEQGGVREYWLLDPKQKRQEFYQRDANGQFQLVRPDEHGVYRSSALPGLGLDVNWFRRDSLPPVMEVLRAWGLGQSARRVDQERT